MTASASEKSTDPLAAELEASRAELAELRRSVESYQGILSRLRIGVVVHAPDTTILYNNAEASQILGLSPEQMAGKVALDPAWQFVREDGSSLPVNDYPVNRVLASLEMLDACVLGVDRPATGDRAWVQVRAFPDFGPRHELLRIVVTFGDISERKRAEDALRTREEVYRALVREATIGIFHSSFEGRFIDVNPALAEVLGYASPEEAVTSITSIAEQVYADPVQRDAVQARALEGDGLVTVENRYRRRDGTLWDGRMHLRVVRDAQGKPSHYEGFVDDITKRKRAEEALRESETRFEQLAANSRTVAWEVDSRGLYTYVSKVSEAVWGYRPDELVGQKHFYELHPAEGREAFKAAAFGALAGKGFFQDSVNPIQAKDGHVVWVLTNGMPLLTAEGTLRGYRGSDTDITERKRAEEALQESEARYRLLFDAIPESVLVIGTDGRVAAANRASARLWGYESSQQLEGFHTPLLIAERDRERAKRIQTEVIQGEEQAPRQYIEVRRDGSEFVAEVTSTTLRGPQQEVLGYIGITRDITTLVEAQAKLRESNELLSQFVRNSPIHAYIKAVTPKESRVLQASDSFRQMIGLSGAEMLGKTMGELFPAELAAKMTADDWSVVATGQVIRLDEELNGRSYETIKFPVVLGDKIFLAGYTTDTTERKQAEAAMQETSRRLQFALRAGHLGVWDWNLEQNIMVWDDEMLALYGLEREQFPGGIEAWNQGLHPADRERAIADWQAALEGRRDFDTEFRVVHPTGIVRHVKANGLVLRDEDGAPIRMLGLNQDITDRKRADAALEQSEGLLRQAQNIARVGHFMFNPATGVVEGSDELFRIFGLTREKFQFSDFVASVHPEDRALDEATIASAIERRSGYEIEHRLLLGDGTLKWVRATGRFVIAGPEEQSVLLGTVQDISERKQADADKAKLEAQLQQAQKMESVGRLAGGVAHDFNNMLGVILGQAEMAMERVAPTDAWLHGHLEEIRKAAERSANLTRQLLAFARKQTVAPKVLDLNETVASMLKMLRRLVGEDVNLVWLPGPELYPIKMDPSQIDQILANLCVNARDAIGGVGKLTIETTNSVLDDHDCAAYPEAVAGAYAKLVVSDDGCGMDNATQERLFEPFFTTKELGKGTGLGLAMVYGIVKQNNGFIKVTSEPNKGTTFEICLPRYGAAKTGTAQAEPLTRPVVRGHETILVVEDEPAILDLTKTMLKRLGYTVLTASTPGEAIRLAGAYNGVIHLLMTDVVMPEMNGRDLAKNLLTSYPDLKRLFMSGYTADVIAHHGVLDQGVHFIQKPFSKKDLAARVSEALERE